MVVVSMILIVSILFIFHNLYNIPCQVYSMELLLQSVLVETQDKALRRISELREQCSLEQSAKVGYYIYFL